jgi:hypothetical protein
MGYFLWILLTVAWNAVNSCNSRAKNSSSKVYNFTSTLCVSALYVLSVAYAANLLIQAHASGRRDLFAGTVVVYAIASAVGSILGQAWALKFEKSHHIKHNL